LLEITNTEELERAEASITTTEIALLTEQPVDGNFDLSHLEAIHQRLFGTIYDWAGKIRTIELDRDTTKFANTEFIPDAAKKIFDELAKEKYLDELSDEDYITRMAHYYSEVNILHPFREGNGRTQRAFFSLLASRTGRFIAWDKMDPAENIDASIAAYNGDEMYLAKMLTNLVKSNN